MKYAATTCGLLALVVSTAHAQAPRSAESVVPPAEVTNIVRSNGLSPLGPPVRQRSIYVLRATNARGAQMSVVVDAHDGRMLAVAPVTPGLHGGRVGAFGPPPSSPRGYAAATPQPHAQPGATSLLPEGDAAPLLGAWTRSAPPLPRPRPANLVAEKDEPSALPAPPDNPVKSDEPAKVDSPPKSDAPATKPHGGPLPINN